MLSDKLEKDSSRFVELVKASLMREQRNHNPKELREFIRCHQGRSEEPARRPSVGGDTAERRVRQKPGELEQRLSAHTGDVRRGQTVLTFGECV